MNKRVIAFFLAGALLFGSGRNVIATTVTDVKQQQTQTKNKLNEVNKSITAIENKRKEVQAQLSNLNEDLVETLLTLELLAADLEAKELEIEEAQAEYEKYKTMEEEQYRSMKLRIKYLYEVGDVDYITLFLQAESITDFLNKADFVKQVSDYDEGKRAEYQETKELVAEQKIVLEEEQAELEEVQEAQQVYKEQLDRQIASAKSKVANFETELASAQAKAREYQNTIKEQSAMIKKLEEEERKRQEAANAVSTAPAGTSGSSTADPNSANNSTTSSENSSKPTESKPTASGSGNGTAIANYALQFVGNPYVFGGTSLTKGADCSGFTMSVHKHFGISIPRSSVGQASGGKSVSISNVQPGDIIYYGNHVGIYIGNGQIVHASTAKTGIKISNYTYRTPICVRRYW